MIMLATGLNIANNYRNKKNNKVRQYKLSQENK